MFRDIALELLAKIRDDGAVASWCAANGGKPISLFLGVGGTPETNPKAEDLPLAIVTEGTVTHGPAGRPQSAVITLGWDVSVTGETETDGIREVSGAKASEELGNLIAAAINTVEREYSVTSVEMTPATTGEWAPRFPGVMIVSLELR